jgi:hypothetical protein
MRATSIAAFATALIATAPISAAADQVITESFSVTIPNSVVPDNNLEVTEFDTTPFPLFAPTTGTLESVKITFSGSVTVVSLIANPEVSVILGTENNVMANLGIGSGKTNINLSGSDQASFYIGTGDDTFPVFIGSTDYTATLP